MLLQKENRVSLMLALYTKLEDFVTVSNLTVHPLLRFLAEELDIVYCMFTSCPNQ